MMIDTSPEQGRNDAAGQSRPHILLVEDNIADVGLVREALEQHNVDCVLTVLMDGERAMKLIDEIDARREACPDLILLDLNLPRKPGSEVLKRLRSKGRCQDVPVVVLTSSDNERDKQEVAAFAPTRYITKPSNLDQFLSLGATFKHILEVGSL